ncbi:transporter substrate-binding domain-containing protein [Moraxella bovis]|uniref:transporter substrate-binding domain-containing protein n=1 Tax=Moraxella bovis TaxID=476 RepID=UPI002225E58E|nr:transporter substrate-binding domain-containing protein [Moraxella bovis]UYZ69053.1 transporter substrate-binding domain-containing protein [Moraxella bovis]UYZ71427.1 transporter substrate-binding domain-containing protein [Moraxella bovis]UYZ72660.1 transporter substrate-binding domain-containing protein [Moraxella bovis]UZA14721.1 transporter substrate-binding domain-containing protein [Moraxella bovis]UZA26917.1 transporter substrate-binding domain-containing protein [Moraxella bovis]
MKIKYLAVALTALALTACGGDKPADTTANTATTGTNDGKKVLIATESSFKPFSYLDNTGNLVGFEIDLANALCTEMKADCDIVAQDWDSLIPSLQANKSDAIMAGMSITPERLEVLDFSDAYFDNTLILVGKKGDNITINDLAGKTVGVQQATVSGEYLAKHQPNATVKAYDKQDNVHLDLSAGRIDYMLADFVPASDWLKTDAGANFEIKGEPIDINDKVGIAVRKDDALKGEFNTALANLKASGKYDELVAKYFAITGSASVPDNAPAPADTPAPAGDTKPVSEPADANASETAESTKK